jgi:hypothetical protein
MNAPSLPRRGLSLVSALLILLVVIGALYYFQAHRPGLSRRGGGDAAAEQAAADLKPLEGTWVRPDNGVTLEISGTDRPGPVTVWASGPANPSVFDASARSADGIPELRMEYSDDACSGCSCRFNYDETKDRLVGSCQESGGAPRAMVFTRSR